ncbi:MAG: YraN family protein [Deltaproteobacteria bacterium]|nr:YraN family protein [Deltaproteobacteria bacterium]
MNCSGRIQTGKRGEDIAVAYLKNRGYRIIERNYKCLFGEIDIVAKDGDTVVFVEVKSRKSEKFGDPQGAVGREKQKKISRISLKYLEEKHLYPCDARFDVVAIKMLPAGSIVELIQNAFELVPPYI